MTIQSVVYSNSSEMKFVAVSFTHLLIQSAAPESWESNLLGKLKSGTYQNPCIKTCRRNRKIPDTLLFPFKSCDFLHLWKDQPRLTHVFSCAPELSVSCPAPVTTMTTKHHNSITFCWKSNQVIGFNNMLSNYVVHVEKIDTVDRSFPTFFQTLCFKGVDRDTFLVEL